MGEASLLERGRVDYPRPFLEVSGEIDHAGDRGFCRAVCTPERSRRPAHRPGNQWGDTKRESGQLGGAVAERRGQGHRRTAPGGREGQHSTGQHRAPLSMARGQFAPVGDRAFHRRRRSRGNPALPSSHLQGGAACDLPRRQRRARDNYGHNGSGEIRDPDRPARSLPPGLPAPGSLKGIRGVGRPAGESRDGGSRGPQRRVESGSQARPQGRVQVGTGEPRGAVQANRGDPGVAGGREGPGPCGRGAQRHVLRAGRDVPRFHGAPLFLQRFTARATDFQRGEPANGQHGPVRRNRTVGG